MSETYQLHVTAPNFAAKDGFSVLGGMEDIKHALPALKMFYSEAAGWKYSFFILHNDTHCENVTHKWDQLVAKAKEEEAYSLLLADDVIADITGEGYAEWPEDGKNYTRVRQIIARYLEKNYGTRNS